MESESAVDPPSSTRLGRFLARFGVPLVVYVCAVVARALHQDVPIYGDEAAHYYFARHPFQNPSNILEFGGGAGGMMSLLFWARPLFHLLLFPAALVSFDAYRLLHLVLTASLAPIAVLVLRSWGVRGWVAASCGLAAAFLPSLVNWGVVVFPDSLATALFSGGILARRLDRQDFATALFVGSMWVKEICFVGVVYVLAWDLVAGLRSGSNRLFPVRMDGPSLRGVKSLLLGLAPLAFYLAREGRAPGWSPGSGDLGFVDGLLPALLMSPILLLGLVWRRTPFIAGLALVYPAFYLVYATVLGRGVESWYMVQPLFLGLLGFSIVVDQLIGPAKAAVRTARGGLGVAAGLLVFGLVAVQVVAPSTWEPKSELLAPISKNSQQSLQEVYDVSKADPLFEMRGHMTDEDLRHQFLIDFGWFYIAYPMAEGAASVRYGYTGYELTTVAEVQRWTSRIENSTATVIHTPASLPPLNHALRAAYADCRTFENEDYEVFRGAECGDRLAAVVREYEARVGRSLG